MATKPVSQCPAIGTDIGGTGQGDPVPLQTKQEQKNERNMKKIFTAILAFLGLSFPKAPPEQKFRTTAGTRQNKYLHKITSIFFSGFKTKARNTFADLTREVLRAARELAAKGLPDYIHLNAFVPIERRVRSVSQALMDNFLSRAKPYFNTCMQEFWFAFQKWQTFTAQQATKEAECKATADAVYAEEIQHAEDTYLEEKIALENEKNTVENETTKLKAEQKTLAETMGVSTASGKIRPKTWLLVAAFVFLIPAEAVSVYVSFLGLGEIPWTTIAFSCGIVAITVFGAKVIAQQGKAAWYKKNWFEFTIYTAAFVAVLTGLTFLGFFRLRHTTTLLTALEQPPFLPHEQLALLFINVFPFVLATVLAFAAGVKYPTEARTYNGVLDRLQVLAAQKQHLHRQSMALEDQLAQQKAAAGTKRENALAVVQKEREQLEVRLCQTIEAIEYFVPIVVWQCESINNQYKSKIALFRHENTKLKKSTTPIYWTKPISDLRMEIDEFTAAQKEVADAKTFINT